MKLYLVTVKLPRIPGHDPKNKKSGPCPMDEQKWCTDVTGQHHTLAIQAASVEHAVAPYVGREMHITRVEEA